MRVFSLVCIFFLFSLLWFPSKSIAAPIINSVAATGTGGCVVVNGFVWCWGTNTFGQLGNGTLVDNQNAVNVLQSDNAPLSKVTSISGNGTTYCAVSNLQLWCWGKIIDGTYSGKYTAKATRVKNANGSLLTNAKSIAIGSSHACVTMTNRQLMCWGDNYYGQIGAGVIDSVVKFPTRVKVTAISYLSNVQSVSLGYRHSCAVASKRVFCWGESSGGRLGVLDAGSNHRLYAVGSHSTLTEVTSVSVGYNHSCVINNSDIYCWGNHDYGQLGDPILPAIFWVNYGYENGTPALVKVVKANLHELPDATTLSNSMGGYSRSTCAIIVKNVWCWGHNEYGQLGDGYSFTRAGAVMARMPNMQPITNVSSVSTNHNGTCAAIANQLWCWGYYKKPERKKYASGAFIP